VQAASAEDVDKAVQCAKKALQHPSWKLLSGTERGKLIAKLADLVEENQELLASIDAWDNGQFCAIGLLKPSLADSHRPGLYSSIGRKST